MSESFSAIQIQAAVDAISERILRAENHWENFAIGPEGGRFDEELAQTNLRDAWLLTLDLLHKLELPALLASAKDHHAAFEKDPLASRMGDQEPFLVHADELRGIVQMVRDVYLGKATATVAEPSLDALLSLLRRAETYITSRAAFGFVPAREEDVHQRLQGLLECSFSDVEPRPALSSMGGIKSFIPDTGVRSLRTVIDYKYIEDRPEGRTVLDEIYADMNGYRSDDYDNFVFVIYETTRVFSEENWNAAIKRAKPTYRVEAIVLKGTPPSPDDKKASDALKGKKSKAKADVSGAGSAPATPTTPAPAPTPTPIT